MDNGEGAPPGLLEQNGEQPSNINFSDVFEAILVAEGRDAGGASSAAGGGGGEPAGAGGVDDEMYRPAQEQRPYCRILEQPASKALRFRYECEGRSAGSIPGANSTPEKKTFPTIEIVGHKGRAIVVVSCVTKDPKDQYRPHPHNLVGRELCKKGVCTVNVGADSGGVVTFSNLGIQCVKRRDIEDALRLREEMRVDPFKTGFSHKNQPQSIDLNAVRLCFQVFLPDERTGKIRHALPPVVSDVIYDKKAMSDLVISRLSHCSAPVTGGTKIILLCEKVAREDIAVTFYESNPGGTVVWRADAGEMYVHKQVAICVTTPRYREPTVTRHVQAFIQLRRLSDNQTSEPVAFELLPASADSDYLRRKRQKTFDINPAYSQQGDDMNPHMPEYYELIAMQRDQRPIKLEPRERQASLASPPLSVYSPQHEPQDQHYQQWAMPDNMQGGLTVPGPGPSHLSPYQGGDMTWGQTMSPLAPAVSPNMAHAPHMSPNMGHRSPNMGHGSPNMGHGSPNMGHVSPNMGHVSPNMAQMQSTMIQQQTITQLQQTTMECTTVSDPPSITGLLLGECMPQLNSSELSGLSSLLADADRPTDTLSETLNRLSTADLMPSHMQ